MIFKGFDLETTGTDVNTCDVLQAGLVEVRQHPSGRMNFDDAKCYDSLFYATDIPAGATAVHSIRDEDVAHCQPFAKSAERFAASLVAPDVVGVSYNGCGFDIPVIARVVAQALRCSRESVESRLRARHVDVMRLWLQVKALDLVPPWQPGLAEAPGEWWSLHGRFPALTASMFAGTLTACHGFYLGHGFEGAHDATVDVKATLAAFDEMLACGHVPDVETAIAWSNSPLPGDVDFAGKFRWDEDGEAVITFGRHGGALLRDVPRSYLDWMAGDRSDFPQETKSIAREAMRGTYPRKQTT